MSSEHLSQNNFYWDAVKKAWPDSVVVEGQRGVSLSPKICVVLCPLYAKGSKWENSRLIGLSESIDDSRVARKLEPYIATVQALHEAAQFYGEWIEPTFVFTNKGVHVDPETQDVELLLSHHQQLYEKKLRERFSPLGLDFQLLNYDDIGVNFPMCVDLDSWPVGLVNPQTSMETAMLNSFQSILNLVHTIPINKDARKVVKNIMEGDNISFISAFWIIASYLVFDEKIYDIVGAGGIYVMVEKMNPLFWIYKLTPSLKEVNKIMLYG